MTQGHSDSPRMWVSMTQKMFSDEVLNDFKAEYPEYSKTLGNSYSSFLSTFLDDFYIHTKTLTEHREAINAVLYA